MRIREGWQLVVRERIEGGVKRLWIGWVILLIAAFAFGKDKAAVAPTIPDTLLAKYWKAQAQVKSAQEALQAANLQAQAAIQQIQAVCGAEFQPQLNQQGDPVCTTKPDEVKK